MRDKLKIVVFIAKDAKSVEEAIRGGDYTWEVYPDAKCRTDDLIAQVDAYVDVDYRDEIARRLRAADALYEAANALGENPGIAVESSAWWGLYSKMRKAIADYEEEK